MPKTDYNKLASAYNKRYENNNLAKIENQLNYLIASNKYKTILEVGCGTGRWIRSLKSTGTTVFGLDSSVQMLKIAKSDANTLNLIGGDAISFPFKNNVFDIIFCVNALHHFSDKEKFVSECKGTLSANGMLAIIGVDPYKDKNWYVYDYFDSVYKNDLKRFLSVNGVKLILERTGFVNSSISVVDKVYNKRIGSDVFNDPFLQKNHSSQLANLTDYEYELGMQKIKERLNKNQNSEFETLLNFYLISAIKK